MEFLQEPCKDFPHGYGRDRPGRNPSIQRKSIVRIVFQNRFRIVSGNKLASLPLLVVPMPIIVEFDQGLALFVGEAVTESV